LIRRGHKPYNSFGNGAAIAGGTSLVVYPAAGLIDYFHGRHLLY
jgi:hypothetical protein